MNKERIDRLTNAMREMEHAFSFGSGDTLGGLVDVAQTASTHVGNLIDHLHTLQEDRNSELKRRNEEA